MFLAITFLGKKGKHIIFGHKSKYLILDVINLRASISIAFIMQKILLESVIASPQHDVFVCTCYIYRRLQYH